MYRVVLVIFSFSLLVACTNGRIQDYPFEQYPGGETTVSDTSATGLGRAVKNLDPKKWDTILMGKRVFVRDWRFTKTGKGGFGLGPYHNGRSCTSCHFHDGRGASAKETEPLLTVKLALPARNLAVTGLPYYGSQFHRYSEGGLIKKGGIELVYITSLFRVGEYARSLKRPIVKYHSLKHGSLPKRAAFSPRIPGSLAGLGLLEAIPQQKIIDNSDPHDRDNDGISGRVSWIKHGNGRRILGRFGWKASQASIAHQVATALKEDMGITNSLSTGSICDPNDVPCVQNDKPGEMEDQDLQHLINYVRLLAVPKRRRYGDPLVQRGKSVFNRIGCQNCHIPRFHTGSIGPHAELHNQTIFPYSDLLLHDMGSELSDGFSEQSAQGGEWRTPPLWGLGLLRKIHGRLFLLHDGRAESVEEAILWHGGEAQRVRRNFVLLSNVDRRAVELFVESL